ncbi:MAG: flagellar hook-associated protein FlgL [Pirellulaceae bacterium]|jgi:flagellin-like hook-associated protein FlgL|nr:flagellar hook-associated protein FlgL [Pirellulaceae bacterium]
MAPIYPIPTGRTSDTLVSRRLLGQLQAEQKRLLQVEQQLATGQRIQLPSEDASSATRAVSLQRMLETKIQMRTNLATGQSFLDATDTALSSVAGLLTNARGLALRAADSTTSDLERDALALEIQATIRQLLDTGNRAFRGRYLFAGSPATTRPFEPVGAFVQYTGNNTALRTYATVDQLFETNVPGQDLFGAVSREVQGIDLNPVLTPETRLADLREGQGVRLGSLLVSDGISTSTVSLAGAETLADVVRLLESHPPAGRALDVSIDAQGLRVELDAAGGGNLTIRDEQGGTTAAELGILRPAGGGTGPIIGADLHPVLQLTTPLKDILGARATAVVRSTGSDNDVVLTARSRGSAGNDVTVQYVDHNLFTAVPGLRAGNEYAELDSSARAAQAAVRLSGLGNDLLIRATQTGTQGNNVAIQLDASQNLGDAAQVTYDAGTRTLTLAVDDTNETQLATLVAAINASGTFTAQPDSSRGETYHPAAPVLALDAGLVGNTGNSGGAAHTIYVYIEVGVTTAQQVVTALQANSDIAALFDAHVATQDATSAVLAGSRPVTVDATAVTRGGAGIEWDQESGLQIRNGGQTYVVDLQPAETVEDLLNLVNGAGAGVLAEINAARNGINLRSRLSGTDLTIGEHGGSTATDLGLRSLTENTRLDTLNYLQGVHAAAGTDFTIQRRDGTILAVDVSAARSVGDVLDLINQHPDNQDPATAVTARLAAFGNGIELVDDNATGTYELEVRRELVSQAAWDLGLIPRGDEMAGASPAGVASAAVAFAPPQELNTALAFLAQHGGTRWNGVGVEFRDTLVGDVAVATFDAGANRLIIDMADGQTTANTVIAAVAAEGTLRAELDRSTDPTNDGSGVIVAPLGMAATLAGGTPASLQGADANPIETRGVFNSLIRLQQAIAEFDVTALERIVAMLDEDFDRLNFGRAELGAKGQSLDALAERNDDEQVELKALLSREVDVDMAEAASALLARQAAYEASLRAMASMFRLSLLDFV